MKEIKELNEMERYSMFMDKNQYCKDTSISELDLYIQCIPPPKKKTHSKLFCGCWQIGSKVYMEKQKIHNGQYNVEREEQSQKTDTTQIQDLL